MEDVIFSCLQDCIVQSLKPVNVTYVYLCVKCIIRVVLISG
jgi:hypothetical protein